VELQAVSNAPQMSIAALRTLVRIINLPTRDQPHHLSQQNVIFYRVARVGPS
jgi:hypothetical protein